MKLFLPQATLESWALEDKADLKDGQLVFSGESQGSPLTPAVHFKQCLTGADGHDLVSRVKTEAQLDALGAEHMADSVLLGEVAYEVEPGYVAEVRDAPAQPQPPGAQAAPAETDLLAEFLLNKL